jgi:hypothetical protein
VSFSVSTKVTGITLDFIFVSRSSLYYWAHYDFFNNSRYGERVADSVCDEVFSSWRSPSGWFRSPLNTLVYKRSDPTEDVRCLYRFVTDKRLFARVILTIDTISFKVGLIQMCDPCTGCILVVEKQVDIRLN